MGPATQRFVAGALANAPPLLLPQAPLTVWLALQEGDTVLPPRPLQVHE